MHIYGRPIIPIKGASPNKGAPCGDKSCLYCPRILNNLPIFNPKPQLESSEPQHLAHKTRSSLASMPRAPIRDNTVL